MTRITAKVMCNGKTEWGTGENRMATLGFCADYQDGRNKEWAASTPHLDLRMSVKGDVADHFAAGKKYTLTFAPEQEES